jgi:hypothetical protein
VAAKGIGDQGALEGFNGFGKWAWGVAEDLTKWRRPCFDAEYATIGNVA